MITVFTRTFLIYLILLFTIRLVGKRQIGELELSELVTTLMISELAVLPITDKRIPVSHAIIPIWLLFSLEVIISFMISHSSKLKSILIGRPSVIIKRGNLNQKELSRMRIGVNELFCQLRQKGISSFDEVYYAILEPNGQLSVFPKSDSGNIKPKDMGILPPENGISHPLVISGTISEQSLALSGRDENFIYKQLKNRNITLNAVYLMTVDDGGRVSIVMKEVGK
jgi:uncharacterized membrane protein YcaP (DUF421 family)